MRISSPRRLQTLARGRRIELGMTQEALATKTGVSRKWISEFERGKLSAEFSLVLRLMTALDLELHVDQVTQERQRPQSVDNGDMHSIDLDALLDSYRVR